MTWQPFAPELGMALFFLIWLLFWGAILVLLILTAIWLARKLGLLAGGPGSKTDAMRELDLRYARGEVDRDTYLKTRDDLAGRG